MDPAFMEAVSLGGWSTSGYGASGDSQTSAGVCGTSVQGRGIEGWSTNAEGVFRIGATGGTFDGKFEGVHAVSHNPNAAGVAGYNDNTGPAIYGKAKTGGFFRRNFRGCACRQSRSRRGRSSWLQ